MGPIGLSGEIGVQSGHVQSSGFPSSLTSGPFPRFSISISPCLDAPPCPMDLNQRSCEAPGYPPAATLHRQGLGGSTSPLPIGFRPSPHRQPTTRTPPQLQPYNVQSCVPQSHGVENGHPPLRKSEPLRVGALPDFVFNVPRKPYRARCNLHSSVLTLKFTATIIITTCPHHAPPPSATAHPSGARLRGYCPHLP